MPTTSFPASAAITPSRAAGLREVPCIEKIADDAETLELALIENLQRKDLTPFEEADGLQRLAEQFAYTHEDIARKIAKARSSVTETLSLRNIPEATAPPLHRAAASSRSRCCCRSRASPTKRRWPKPLQRIVQGGLTRDEARRERREEKAAGPRPQPFIFNFQPENEAFRLRIQFRKSNVSREELISTLRGILDSLEQQDQRDEQDEQSHGKANPAVA